MCGFVGFVNKQNNKEQILENMLKTIMHRGPNSCGVYTGCDIALGFRRLSIIDLSKNGEQPFLNEDKSIVLVFNGEIYNYLELKEEFISKGHTFRSKTDTEVLLHGYEEYKENIFGKLRGMFSVAIWDTKEKKLLIARDIFGIKPLYYTTVKDGTFIFGSEIKSFLEHPLFEKTLNKGALKPYLTFQYSAMSQTFFEDVYKLLPGRYLILKDNKFDIKQYHNFVFDEQNLNKDEFILKTASVITDSVSAHKICDVKVGSFLSGGVDSSYITAELNPAKTFSVGFEHKNFDETQYAKQFSSMLGIKCYTKCVSAEECFAEFGIIQYHLDEPSANPSLMPLYFLAKLASEHVKVVLSGEGADELFGGYDAYLTHKDMELYRALLPRSIRKLTAKAAHKIMPNKTISMALTRGAKTKQEDYIGHAYIFSEEESTYILREKYNFNFSTFDITKRYYAEVDGKDDLTQKIYLDFNLWLPGDILLKADKMSMAHSIELRVPFLDKEVMKVANSIPSKYKINFKQTKYILRKAANKKLPNELTTRPKMGFPVPIKLWLQNKKYYEIVKEYFISGMASEFFDNSKILKLLNDHYNEKKNNARKIWTLYTFLVWYEQFFVKR